MGEYDKNGLLIEIRELAELAGIPAGRVNPKMDGSDRRLNAGADLVRLARELVRTIGHLQARPKLWVVRVPYPAGALARHGEVRADTIEIGSVSIGDCGDAVPCIAAWTSKADADYVAGCIGGTVEEWGVK
jgi:hypothetical protein